MSSLLTFLAAFAIAESSAPLPDSLKGLAKSAAAYKDADLAAKKLDLAYKHERAWVGENATAAEETKVEKMHNASRDADAGRAVAKADLEKKVAEAEHADELMHAAQRHEE